MKRILFSLVLGASVFGAAAQWNGSPTAGTNLSKATPPTAASAKTGVVTVTDGAGGMFVAWIDNRASSTPTVFLQRVGPDGVLKFTTDVVVSDATGASSSAKTNLTMIPDGTGGVILSWQDSRNFSVANPSNSDIYGQRIDAAGAPVWAEDGVRLTAADNSVSSKTISELEILVNTPSTTKGVVVFQDNRNGNVDLYAQAFSLATGAISWTADFPVHGTTAGGTQNQQSVTNDGAGGFYVAWQDQRDGGPSADVYAQHVLDNGTAGALPMTGWATTGNVVSAQPFVQFQPQLVSIGTSGFIITWTDQRTAAGAGDIYINRYNADGSGAWAGEVALATATGNQSNPQITESNGNYIVTWSDARSGASNRDIYAQKIEATGSGLWATANGVPITTVTGSNQPASVSATSVGLSIVSDGAGGAIIVWDDARNDATSNTDVYAQRVNSAGTVQWTGNGVAVSTAGGAQTLPIAVASNNGTALVAWRDSRNASLGDVFGARLQANGVLPIRSLTLSAIARNASVDLQWNTIDESNTASFVVEKSSDGVNFAAIGSTKAKGSGNGAYALTDNRPVKGTNYYRIKSLDIDRRFAYSAVVPVNFSGSAKAGIALYPNPVVNAAMLQLSNLAAGNYRLTVRDLSGKAVLEQTVPVVSGYQQTQLSLQSLAAGTYFVQLQKGGEKAFSQMIQKQ